jgi:HAD superfamily hydrolase (TIGR01509 family)
LIFDFDGAIVGTMPLHAHAFEETVAPFGVAVDCASIAGLKTQDAIVYWQRRARSLIAEGLKPIPAVEVFLVRARSRFRMAVVTCGSQGTVTLALRKLGYEDWFDPIVCAEDVARGKPAPDRFLKALAVMQVRRDQALVFEDAESGFEGARAAGLAVVDARSLDWSDAVADI